MIPIPYEAQAKAGEPMPDGLNAVDVGIFQAISCLTERYRMGRVSAEQAQADMRKIRAAYNEAMYLSKCETWRARFNNHMSGALMRYGTNRTLENADYLWRACTGLWKELDPKDDEEHDQAGATGDVNL